MYAFNTHKLHVHLIFSTKERLPLISKRWRGRLHAYLGGVVRGLEGMPLAVGGIEDHVHLLVGWVRLKVGLPIWSAVTSYRF